MNVWKYFQLAKEIATLRDDRRAFRLGAIGIRHDGIIVAACNGRVAIDPTDKRSYFSKAHAEFRLSRKLDKNSIVFVVRIGISDNKFKNGKPCNNCENFLRKRGVSKIYYTISETEYGTITFNGK